MPFEINFEIPVLKVVCAVKTAALLTAEGEVYTWGSNSYGELGQDDSINLVQLFPNTKKPLKFEDHSNENKQNYVIDLEASQYSFVALSD